MLPRHPVTVLVNGKRNLVMTQLSTHIQEIIPFAQPESGISMSEVMYPHGPGSYFLHDIVDVLVLQPFTFLVCEYGTIQIDHLDVGSESFQCLQNIVVKVYFSWFFIFRGCGLAPDIIPGFIDVSLSALKVNI